MPLMRANEPSATRPQPQTIEEWFQLMESPLLSYALKLSGNEEAAEDLVQEAFMKLHSQFDAVSRPKPWLYRTIHNLAINRKRHDSRLVTLDAPPPSGEPAPEPPDPQPLPDEQIARWEGIGLVRLSLQALDERSRELVRLKFVEELSYKDIGQRTGLSTSNVGYLLHHAVKTIASELKRTGFTS